MWNNWNLQEVWYPQLWMIDIQSEEIRGHTSLSTALVMPVQVHVFQQVAPNW